MDAVTHVYHITHAITLSLMSAFILWGMTVATLTPLSNYGKVIPFSFLTLYHLEQRHYMQSTLGNEKVAILRPEGEEDTSVI